jgi:hypothetical protein
LTNCKTNRISTILRQFSQTWEREFVEEIDKRSSAVDEIKNSMDSVVANRHLIAHGRNVGITYATITRYYKCVKVAVEVLEGVVK